MVRTDLFSIAAAVALLCPASSAFAAPSLKATGSAAAGAHLDYEQGQQSLIPGPGSLQVVTGAAASDLVTNPSPPPDDWEMQCAVDGIGIARYGALGGSAHAQASSAPTNDFFLAGGQVSLIVGFTDGVEVVSATLAPATPVTLTFQMTLGATAVHTTDVPTIDPAGTGASARHELKVRDVDDVTKPWGQAALVINSRGVNESFGTFEFDTAVGRRLEIVAELFVSAGVDIDFDTQFAQGAADVLTGTAQVFYEPSGDVGLVSESGHDYAVPEPGSEAWLAALATLILLRRRNGRRPA